MLRDTVFKLKQLKQAFSGERAYALLLAGGSGTRMGKNADIPKQHRLLCGIPVVVRSALALQAADSIQSVTVVAREGEEALYEAYIRDYGLTKIAAVVPGGKTRQESALHGLRTLPPRCKYVAIHDAARCLVTPEEIDRVVLDGIEYKAATAAAQAVDTVKLSDPVGGFTLPEGQPKRSQVYLIQTPQVFDADLYRGAVAMAAEKAKQSGESFTDDCALIERMGRRCRLTLCSRHNLKITNEEDLLLAAAILEGRRAEASASEKDSHS